ncbi:sulfoxide reductase heme-binding subunit YedZ, partial [Escherichia marmotae]|nr:sulfoxide reductase heme-binding subunit YedZ [Escherichia marmotae]
PIHYLWSVKIISMQLVIYAVLVLLLLGLRHNKWFSLFKKLQKLFHHKITT